MTEPYVVIGIDPALKADLMTELRSGIGDTAEELKRIQEEEAMANYENHPVHGVLADMAELVMSKANDYADDENVYSNFEGAAKLSGSTVDGVFHVLIGIKMERLRQLMSGKVPNHESIEDTLMDAANYLALWLGYRRSQVSQLYVNVAETIGMPAEYAKYEIQLDKINGEV